MYVPVIGVENEKMLFAQPLKVAQIRFPNHVSLPEGPALELASAHFGHIMRQDQTHGIFNIHGSEHGNHLKLGFYRCGLSGAQPTT